MNVVLTLFFCIIASNQVNTYDMLVHIRHLQGNSVIPISVNLIDNTTDDTNFDVLGSENNIQYEVIFNWDVDEEHDMPLKFIYYTVDGKPLNAKKDAVKYAKFCHSDHNTFEGTAASITARVLGIEKEPPCPVKKGTRFIRDPFFIVDSDDYQLMLFDPMIGYIEGNLIIETEGHKLLEIVTTFAPKDD